MGKVPPTHSSKVAQHDSALYYQEQDPEGRVHTFFSTHPAGNRMQRRARQRHHPFFTKPHTPGREWMEYLKRK